MPRRLIAAYLVFVTVLFVLSAYAQEPASSSSPSTPLPASTSSATSKSSNTSADTHGSALPAATNINPALEREWRIEGEKKFRANCSRCHMAPHKFPPRVMATAIRHMRVRAMLTDEDMRLILRYMTQ